ncbi:MAG: AIR carboxylase family protein, partial [Thermodesulfovibrionales bacterium]|nr:AIR carboxylase family protein [Thermodesulfovibrionales bacterium]
QGFDALFSTVQMPPGIPVATMAIGTAGAKNAAIFAAEIIGRKDAKIVRQLKEHKKRLKEEVEKKAKTLSKSQRVSPKARLRGDKGSKGQSS